jgi:phosphoribosylanthranilate isomerase
MRCKLKVCGVTQATDAVRLAALGVDAIGVNFWKGSKRYIDPQDAKPFLNEIRDNIHRVGVFVNEDISRIKEIYDEGLIDSAQLHGDEDTSYYEEMIRYNIDFIQVIRIHTEDSAIQPPTLLSNRILLDTFVPNYGGEGKPFNWKLAAEFILAHSEKEVILAGGITPDNAAQAALIKPYMLDVASGVETSPGLKSIGLVQEMLAIIRRN